MTSAREFGNLIRKIETRKLRRLTRSELRAFPVLYRRLVSEVAEARALGRPHDQLAPLEALLGKGHGILYAPERVRPSRSLAQLMRDFPLIIAQHSRSIALASGLLLLGTIWGYLEVWRDPASAAIFLPGSWQQNAEQFATMDMHVGHPLIGTFYFTNNARVALTCYALGATLGIGTIFMLMFNGVLLGATLAIVLNTGGLENFLSFVFPHSGVELAAIIFAAAGGLTMGSGWLQPGWRTRLDALGHSARESLPLALGSALLLIVAGLVEGWISPSPWPLAAKVALGMTLNIALLWYLTRHNYSRRISPRTERGRGRSRLSRVVFASD